MKKTQKQIIKEVLRLLKKKGLLKEANFDDLEILKRNGMEKGSPITSISELNKNDSYCIKDNGDLMWRGAYKFSGIKIVFENELDSNTGIEFTLEEFKQEMKDNNIANQIDL